MSTLVSIHPKRTGPIHGLDDYHESVGGTNPTGHSVGASFGGIQPYSLVGRLKEEVNVRLVVVF
jgi:hypothetical protein